MSLFKRGERLKYTVEYNNSGAETILANYINYFTHLYPFDHWVIVCIGTDRSTGDSLGPLIGNKLKTFESIGYTVFGTLDEPVHALNLKETLMIIENKYTNSGILAIDASLGQISSVGNIQILDGALKPGAGVKKELPEIGHFHITGIVNIGGFMEYFVLQNTRLSVVMRMAEVISLAIINIFAAKNKGNAINE